MALASFRTDLDFASRPVRMIGQAVDAVVAFVPFAIFLFAVGTNMAAGLLGLVSAASSIAYYLFADALPGGQSLAKRWLGIAVVDQETGAPCTPWQSFVRNLLLAVLGPLDWIFIFGDRHQRLGDKAAGTVVVEVGT